MESGHFVIFSTSGKTRVVKSQSSMFYVTLIVIIQFKLLKCIYNFVLVMTSVLERSYTSNLGNFLKDFYELSMIFISYKLELNQILQIKENVY